MALQPGRLGWTRGTFFGSPTMLAARFFRAALTFRLRRLLAGGVSSSTNGCGSVRIRLFAERFRRYLGNPAIPLSDRVRMTCSVVAVLGALMAGSELNGDVPLEEIARQVRVVVADRFPEPT